MTPFPETISWRFLHRSGTRRYMGHEPRSFRGSPPVPTSMVLASLRSPLSSIWFVLTRPFRILILAVELLGRLAGTFLGFLLMVLGMALWAGPLLILGIPLFIVGLLLTLRSLG